MPQILILLVLSAIAAFGQQTTTSTTLSTALSSTTNADWCIGSATGVRLPSTSNNGSFLMVDREIAQVTGQGGSSTCFKVKRAQLGSAQNAHAATSRVWVGGAGVGSGDSSRPFTDAFVSTLPSGACVASAQYTLPIIYTGPASGGAFSGSVINCIGSRWSGQTDKVFYVPPTQCTFAPTTLTTTNTYIQTGSSNTFVLNGTSNAAAGTNTLTCNIVIPTAVTALQGAVITDITGYYGSQTTAPTSIGTATLGSISFATPATGAAASTVTPVSFGGTITNTVPTAITTVTTAGSFLPIKSALGTPVTLSTDNQILVYKLPFVQSAASAMTINTPGLIVHYAAQTTLP
jgi:hypothetical protein